MKRYVLTPLGLLWVASILLAAYLVGEWVGDRLFPALVKEPEPWHFENVRPSPPG